MSEEMLLALAAELQVRQEWEEAFCADVEQTPLKMAA
jgi:hypothetical protein